MCGHMCSDGRCVVSYTCVLQRGLSGDGLCEASPLYDRRMIELRYVVTEVVCMRIMLCVLMCVVYL